MTFAQFIINGYKIRECRATYHFYDCGLDMEKLFSYEDVLQPGCVDNECDTVHYAIFDRHGKEITEHMELTEEEDVKRYIEKMEVPIYGTDIQ